MRINLPCLIIEIEINILNTNNSQITIIRESNNPGIANDLSFF